jgi:serine phosphatase RsbU (regulator of sigma subunit)/CHASE3 domain sensor protein
MSTIHRKRFAFENRVWLLLVVILLVVTFSGFFVYRNLSDIVNDIVEEARPDETVILMKEMLYDISDAENSVKSYSLTNEAPYLERFNNKVQGLDKKIDRLRELTVDRPETKSDVDSLDSLISKKFVILEDILILRSQYRVDNALDNLLSGIESTSPTTQKTITTTKMQGGNSSAGQQTASQETEDKFFKKIFNKRKDDQKEASDEKITRSDRKNSRNNTEEVADAPEVVEVTQVIETGGGISFDEINQEVNEVKYEESLINRSDREKELMLIMEDKKVMDQVLAIFMRMENGETLSMAEKLAVAEGKSARTKIVIAVFCILACTLLFFAGYAVNSYVKKNNAFKRELEKSKQETEEKNREITDSIVYAQRIQEAILPDLGIMQKYLKDSFILYKPKDIVAGDFYWTIKTDEAVFFAVADCTGHGVPGAMVSVVCNNALNRSVREFGLSKPSEILEKCRDLVIETFSSGNHAVPDGMDIALVAMRLNQPGNDFVKIEYAGANSSMYIMKDNELHEVAADKQPIGKYQIQSGFTNHELTLEKGSSIYLFSDGLADQFGGPVGKKFKYKAFQDLLVANATNTMEHQKRNIDFAFENWKGELEQVDDVCVIGVRV